MKIRYLWILFFLCSISLSAQKKNSYFIDVPNPSLAPEFIIVKEKAIYIGEDSRLRDFFDDYQIIEFNQGFPASPDTKDHRIFYLETLNNDLAENMIKEFPSLFSEFTDLTDAKYELLDDVVASVYIPNDYAPPGGVFERSELDYINAPEAWDLTQGKFYPLVISDARINEENPEMAGKLTFYFPSNSQNSQYNSNNITTFHGTNVAGIAAARGDDSYGTVGVCYDCSVVGTGYGHSLTIFNRFLELLGMGYRVFNMSWANYTHIPQHQQIINTLASRGAILIAGSGNRTSFQTEIDFIDKILDNTQPNSWAPQYTGIQYGYPASYDNVISVGSIYHKYDLDDPDSYCCSNNTVVAHTDVKDAWAVVNMIDPSNPIATVHNGYGPVSVPRPNGDGEQVISQNGLITGFHVINKDVDILAPSRNMMIYYKFVEEGQIGYSGQGTSGATPFVTGTVGLMLSLNECLTNYQVEAILKLTTSDAEHLNYNEPFKGLMGAGSLRTGDAVVFTNEMMASNGNAIIDDHIFYRYNFELVNIVNDISLRNVQFIDNSMLKLVAGNTISLEEGTLLEPNNINDDNIDGFIDLSIGDTEPCSRSSIIRNELTDSVFIDDDKLLYVEEYVMVPNAISSITKISKKEQIGSKIERINVSNMAGIVLLSIDFINNYEKIIDFSGFTTGVYIINGYDKFGNKIFSKKALKK